MTSPGAHIKDASIDTSHGCILYVEGLTVSFDGFKALNDLNKRQQNKKSNPQCQYYY